MLKHMSHSIGYGERNEETLYQELEKVITDYVRSTHSLDLNGSPISSIIVRFAFSPDSDSHYFFDYLFGFGSPHYHKMRAFHGITNAFILGNYLISALQFYDSSYHRILSPFCIPSYLLFLYFRYQTDEQRRRFQALHQRLIPNSTPRTHSIYAVTRYYHSFYRFTASTDSSYAFDRRHNMGLPTPFRLYTAFDVQTYSLLMDIRRILLLSTPHTMAPWLELPSLIAAVISFTLKIYADHDKNEWRIDVEEDDDDDDDDINPLDSGWFIKLILCFLQVSCRVLMEDANHTSTIMMQWIWNLVRIPLSGPSNPSRIHLISAILQGIRLTNNLMLNCAPSVHAYCGLSPQRMNIMKIATIVSSAFAQYAWFGKISREWDDDKTTTRRDCFEWMQYLCLRLIGDD